MKKTNFYIAVLILLLSPTNIFSTALQAQKNKVWAEDEGWFSDSFYAPQGYTPEQAVADADAVFEGVVVDYKVFRGIVDRDSTYTVHTIDVTKVFKGKVGKTTSLLVTGGLLWDEIEPDGLVPGTPDEIPKGTSSIFFVKKNTTRVLDLQDIAKFKRLKYKKDNVGCYLGDIKELRGRNSRNNNALNLELEQRFYQPIKKLVGKKGKTYKKLLPKPKKRHKKEKAATEAVEILGLYPLSVAAGLLGDSSLLTIVGTGFGAEKGNVLFKDTETGTYFEAPSDHIRKWQNDTIQVWVPSIGSEGKPDQRQKKYARTGPIRISTDDNVTRTSIQTLTVPYSVQCAFVAGSNRHERGRLMGGGPNPGGYTVVYGETLWNNVPAREAFRRALGKWRCASGVNITEMCNIHDLCKKNIENMPGLLRVDFHTNCMPADEVAEAQTKNKTGQYINCCGQ